MSRVLVAGLGNIFLGDDGFGVQVAQQLLQTDTPDGVVVRDIGIRGIHLAYELLDEFDLLVLIDAVSRGGKPGTLYVIEHRQAGRQGEQTGAMLDAHDLNPDQVLATVAQLGGTLCRTVVVGCEPEQAGPGMGLSATVRRSVDDAVRVVLDVVATAQSKPTGELPGRVPVGRSNQ
ncbi:MAG TPA: hydrogenase maturation protease [Jatrophihabitans sp.]|jgi:hydrogenase maturation protease